MEQNIRYATRLAVVYAIIWFIDLLDASLLNIALPEISSWFRIDPTNAEWALLSFLLATVVGMVLSNPAGANFGVRTVFIGSQWLYLASSLACGLSSNFLQLVLFRAFQGFAGGLAIPIGMNLLMTSMPQDKWAKTGSVMNIFTLLAPALGPVLAGYITTYLTWRWLFFIKLPLSLICVLLSYKWIKRIPIHKFKKFDWFGFLLASISLCLILIVLSEIGKPLFDSSTLIIFAVLSAICAILFVWQEKRFENPIVPFKVFRSTFFSWGNVIQSAANTIFLGATFIIALYLQWGIGFDIVEAGWIMATITFGMIVVMPITGRFYNKIGPLPYMIFGLLLMSGAMFALIFVTKTTPFWLIALIICCEGAGSAGLQTTNFVSIFSEVPKTLKGAASSLYALFKQISASLGIALSTMVLSLSMNLSGIQTLTRGITKELFYGPLIMLGIIPLLALFCCIFIDNKRAIQLMTKQDHLERDIE